MEKLTPNYSELRKDHFRRQLVDKLIAKGMDREAAIKQTGNSYTLMKLAFHETHKTFVKIMIEYYREAIRDLFTKKDKYGMDDSYTMNMKTRRE